MSKKQESLMNLQAALFGKIEQDGFGAVRPYSIRLPLQTSSMIEVIAKVSKQSKNQVIIDAIELGLHTFIETMEKGDADEFMAQVYRMNAELGSEYGDL